VATYVVDTNVYIRAVNDAADRAALSAFTGRVPSLVVSTIVLAEVLLGAARPSDRVGLARVVTAGQRPNTPTRRDWLTASRAIAALGGDAVTKSHSFWNDTLLAAQCARLGLVLVTHNVADFARLARVIPVTAVAPFPA